MTTATEDGQGAPAGMTKPAHGQSPGAADPEAGAGPAAPSPPERPSPGTAVLIDSSDVPQPAREGGTGADPAGPAGDGQQPASVVTDLESERRQLIDLLIYAWDRARSAGVWERLTDGLAAVGVQVLRPDGEPFDPNVHEVGGIEPTEQDALVDTVAETEVAGFADRGTMIREPVVVVYRRSSSG